MRSRDGQALRHIHFRAKVLGKFNPGQRHSRILKIGFQLRQFDRRTEIPRGKLARDIKPLLRHLEIGPGGSALFFIRSASLFHRAVMRRPGSRDFRLCRLDPHRQRIGVQADNDITPGDGGAFAQRQLTDCP